MKMSNIILLALIGVGLVTSFSFIYSAKRNLQIIPNVKIIGNANTITKALQIEEFHSIELSDGITCILSKGPHNVEVHAEDNIIDYVSAINENGTAIISLNYPEHVQLINKKPIIVKIQSPTFKIIDAMDQSEVIFDEQFVQDSLVISMDDQSVIKGEIDVKILKISAFEQSSIAISGVCESLDLEMDDQVRMIGEGLVTQNAVVEMDHQGFARLNIVNQLSGHLYDTAILEVLEGGDVSLVKVRDMAKLNVVNK